MLSDDEFAEFDFLSWLMGERIAAAEERFEHKHGDQTIDLLTFVDASSIEKYNLNDECLFLIIAGELDTPITNRSQTLQISGKNDEWSINGAKLETSEIWSRLGEWQTKQYRSSVLRISREISEGLRTRVADSEAMNGTETAETYTGTIDLKNVKCCSKFFWCTSISFPEIRTASKKAIEDELKRLRLAREVLKPDSKAKCIADIRDRIEIATRNGSPFFVYEKVFNELMHEYVVKDTTELCRMWCNDMKGGMKRKLFGFLEANYGHLSLCAELKKRFDKEFAANVDALMNWIKEEASKATVASSLFDEMGQVDIEKVKRARTNHRSGLDQPRFDSTTDSDEIIASEMFSVLHAFGMSEFSSHLVNEIQKLSDFEYAFDRIIPLHRGYEDDLYKFCYPVSAYRDMKEKSANELAQFETASIKFQELKDKLLEKHKIF